MKSYKIQNPFVLVIFGASGDLAKLKLFPALYSLAEQKRFPKNFAIVGFARTPKSQEEFKKEFEDGVKKAYKDAKKATLADLTRKIHYFHGQYDEIKDFKKLRTYLHTLLPQKNVETLAYFSVPPVAFKDIIKNLGETKENKNENLKLILEKPFGEDTKSARALFHFVARYFDEEKVYLLDHYLGKSAVQSILNLRHSNRLLNLMMKGPEIANIQITAFEDIGVKNRISYFEEVGTIKDMIQSHLFQILSLIAMSIPITENAESIHREKYSILSALKFNKSPKNIVIGQYGSYKKEHGVAKNSKTETFAALRLFIDRESWYKVPIYIRTGKKLHEKHTYAVVEIKKFAFQSKEEKPNRLVVELQPEEKVSIKLANKNIIGEYYHDLTVSSPIACYGDECLSEHSLLILDVIRERREHFLSFPEIIATWEITDQIVDFIKNNKINLEVYKDGSKGPISQNKLTEIDNFKWFDVH